MAAPSPGNGGPPTEGWNDPPMYSFNPTGTGQTTQRTHLNKRVSFPLTSGSSPPLVGAADSTGMLLSPKDGPPKLPPVKILPPASSTTVHPPVPLVVPSMSPPIDPTALPPSFLSATHDPLKMETLPELLERLSLDSADSLRKYTKKILHEMVDMCKEGIQGRSREDVQTRLGLLDDQWRDEKLSEGAKIKLGSLASALKNKDLKQADSLHLALMVDNISEVSQWMVGVKRLINELKLTQSPPPTSQLKKIFTPETTETTVSSSVDGDAATPKPAQDLCVDTDKFSNLKPVLMPEDLTPAPPASQPQEEKSQQQGEEGKETENR